MSDLIDRQKAIGGTTLKESVKALQDVFVEHDLVEKGEKMSDLIERQAAITAICEDGTWLESQGCTEITMCERKQRDTDILLAIDAEPVRHGRWVNKNNGKWNTLPVFMCSECGDYDPRLYGNENYCPNCGAKMDGERRTDAD